MLARSSFSTTSSREIMEVAVLVVVAANGDDDRPRYCDDHKDRSDDDKVADVT